ncbi:MAG: hypothetical protein Kow00133_19010 [Amphiplicatus sp.]|jgi:hypothetical protein
MDYFAEIPAIREHYAAHGWAVLRGALPIELADATLYQIQRELGGDWESYKGDYIKTFLTDKKAFECYSYDYTPMATLQYGLTPFVSAVTGKDLLPSHAYFRVYRKGDVCHIHSDAANCEHALSLTLGYADDFLWGFNISEKYFDADEKRPAESVKPDEKLGFYNLPLSVGDAILYNGINYLHGRTTPNPNRWAAHIFFHWVDRNGRHARHAFDGRARDIVRRAEFVFPSEDKPEKINPNRAPMAESRRR